MRPKILVMSYHAPKMKSSGIPIQPTVSRSVIRYELLTWGIIVELECPWVGDVRRCREIDNFLGAHLGTRQSHHAVGISSIRQRLQEEGIQLVNLSTIRGISARRLVDRLQGEQVGLAGQRLADLMPCSGELLKDHGQVGIGLGDVRPDPRVCEKKNRQDRG